MEALFLEKLFQEYAITENEYVQSMYSIISKPTNPEWSIERQLMYRNGLVIGKYREGDKKTIEFVQQEVSPDEIKRVIKDYYISEIEMLVKLKNINLDPIRSEQLKMNRIALGELQSLELNEWLPKYQLGLYNALPKISEDEFIGFVYLYYAYEAYKKNKNHFLNAEQNNIDVLYSKEFEKKSPFHKYGLIPINEDIELLCINPPRIYDKLRSKTIFIKDIPLCLVEKLQELIRNNLIKELAVRVCNKGIIEGKNEMEVLLEELERGKKFSFDNLGIFDVIKLYSKRYEDCLWIVIDSENITFEELCEDFNTYEEQVVTQVIHLQYHDIDEQICITHLDHEYIFYSLEEFDIRKSNMNQKGNSHKRMKTFKLDNACIPFEFSYKCTWKDIHGNECPPVSVPFIYYVLDCYFQHKDLLREYFQDVIG